MVKYLNIKDANGIETIDEFCSEEFESYKAFRDEVRKCLCEYRKIYSGKVYVSQRCTNNWRSKL